VHRDEALEGILVAVARPANELVLGGHSARGGSSNRSRQLSPISIEEVRTPLFFVATVDFLEEPPASPSWATASPYGDDSLGISSLRPPR
jgi:hypothetical protein